jgi:multidrug efflux pump subunit AcrB
LFGVLGWIGHSIDIGSVMTASLAMGIAVDDTLHFLTFFQKQIDSGATRQTAVLATYRNCGRAMLQTTLVCGAGLAVFALSDFLPTARFAWMMVALLTAAILGDLVILPALILSPLGKFLYDNRGPRPDGGESDANDNLGHTDRLDAVGRNKTVPRLAAEIDHDPSGSPRRGLPIRSG